MADTRLEMIYTPYQQACRDPHITTDGDLRECRRQHKHDGPHASDHPYTEWGRA
jgi:hypothetical protein